MVDTFFWLCFLFLKLPDFILILMIINIYMLYWRCLVWKYEFHGGPAYVTSYRGYRGWLATAHYALQDNVGVTGYYGFNNKTNKSIGENDKLPNYYRVDLNYQF